MCVAFLIHTAVLVKQTPTVMEFNLISQVAKMILPKKVTFEKLQKNSTMGQSNPSSIKNRSSVHSNGSYCRRTLCRTSENILNCLLQEIKWHVRWNRMKPLRETRNIDLISTGLHTLIPKKSYRKILKKYLPVHFNVKEILLKKP